MRPPRCRAASSCCATSRSAPGETEYVQLVLERPHRRRRRRPLRGARYLVEPHRRRRRAHRSARAGAAAAHAGAAGRDRGAGGAGCRRGAASVLLAGPARLDRPRCFLPRPRARPAAAAARSISELALVTLAVRAAGRAPCCRRPGSACGRASAQTLDAFHAERPDLPGIGLEQLRKGEKPPLPAPLFMAALRKLAEAGEVALDRTWVRRPQPRGQVLRRGGADLGADPAAACRRALSAAARARHRQGHGHRRGLRAPPDAHGGAARRRRGDRARSLLPAPGGGDDGARSPSTWRRTRPTGKFTAADFRDRLDNGRKVAIQILEFFDRHGFTIRRQDLRRINPARIELFAPKAAQQRQTEESRSRWGDRTSNPGGAVRRSQVGSTPILLRHPLARYRDDASRDRRWWPSSRPPPRRRSAAEAELRKR